MANPWTNEVQPFGANRAPLLVGLSVTDGLTPVPVAVDPSTGSILAGMEIGGIYNTVLPTLSNGNTSQLQLDSNGRLLTNPGALTAATDTITAYQGGNWTISTIIGQSAETTATWTSATAQNTTVQLNVSSFPTIAIFISQTSTLTAGAVTFEASDTSGGTNWYPVTVVATDNTFDGTVYTLNPSTNIALQMNVAGFILFRVRLSTAITGSGTVSVGLTGNASAAEWEQFVFGNVNVPLGSALVPYSAHLTSNATTTPTSSTAYISSIAISTDAGGTTSTVTVQDKSGTPKKLVNALATTALSTTPTVVNFQSPVVMSGGIDIVTAGAAAATIDIWINYYQ